MEEVLGVLGAVTWTVTLTRPNKRFGYGLLLEGPAIYVDDEGCGAVVAEIEAGSPAASSGKIHQGDLIVQVDGTYVLYQSLKEVNLAIARAGVTVKLLLASAEMEDTTDHTAVSGTTSDTNELEPTFPDHDAVSPVRSSSIVVGSN